jgi:hypothetical protein
MLCASNRPRAVGGPFARLWQYQVDQDHPSIAKQPGPQGPRPSHQRQRRSLGLGQPPGSVQLSSTEPKTGWGFPKNPNCGGVGLIVSLHQAQDACSSRPRLTWPKPEVHEPTSPNGLLGALRRHWTNSDLPGSDSMSAGGTAAAKVPIVRYRHPASGEVRRPRSCPRPSRLCRMGRRGRQDLPAGPDARTLRACPSRYQRGRPEEQEIDADERPARRKAVRTRGRPPGPPAAARATSQARRQGVCPE